MSRRLPLLLLGAAVLAMGCGGARRGTGEPAPRPGPAAAADTAPSALARDSALRAAEDSLQQARARAESLLVTPPGAPGAPATPSARPEKPPQRCVLDLVNRTGTGAMMVKNPVTGRYYTVVGGGVFGRCRGQQVTIEADSAEGYEDSRLYLLIGNVRYREPKLSLDAQRATYFRAEERILLENAVHAEMPHGGGTLDGPRAEYWRAVSGVRERPRIVATGRPRLTYVEKDSAGRPQPPVLLDADVIIGEGDSTFFAYGRVLITRDDILAHGDSAMMDGNRQFSRLMKKPFIESRGAQPYTLFGEVIDLFGGTRRLDRVIAIDSARAVSKEFTVRSDTIDLRVEGSKLNRAFAFGTSGAFATTPERNIVADSLDIIMPEQRIRELRAIGKAFVESDPDSTKVRSADRDWLRGDTVIARFDSVAAGDTSRPQLETLFAAGTASAIYQIPSSEGKLDRPGINYVRGDVIRLMFSNGEVQTVQVNGNASGVYLEPAADTAAVPPVRPNRPPVPPRGRTP